MADIIQIRRDTAANWTAANPILAQGEFGVETDTLKLKIGDGASPWTGLRYYHSGSPYEAGEGISINDFTINNTGIITIGTGGANGTIKANGQDIAVKGLGSAAFVDTTTLPNKDLSNLTSTGQNIGNWSTNVTNCITEISQDINLTLSNGTLTLKAGSKVYIPNGSSVFDTVTINSDISFGSSSTPVGGNNVQIFIAYRNGVLTSRPVFTSVSGAGATAVGGFAYDTTTNKISFYNSDGSLQSSDWSFPIAIVSTNSNGIASSIDQVFNGFGFIGSTIFSLPGVKLLAPNGRNADGTLKNVLVSITTVNTYTYSGNADLFLIPRGNGFGWQSTSSLYYDAKTNYNRRTSDNVAFVNPIVGIIKMSSNKITAIEPYSVFHAVDYNDGEYIANCAMPSGRYIDLTRGSTSPITLIAPADGYYILVDEASANNSTIRATVYPSALYYYCYAGNIGSWFGITCPVSKGQEVLFYFNTSDTNVRFRFVYANGAK